MLLLYIFSSPFELVKREQLISNESPVLQVISNNYNFNDYTNTTNNK